jgi:hypothetical protein
MNAPFVSSNNLHTSRKRFPISTYGPGSRFCAAPVRGMYWILCVPNLDRKSRASSAISMSSLAPWKITPERKASWKTSSVLLYFCTLSRIQLSVILDWGHCATLKTVTRLKSSWLSKRTSLRSLSFTKSLRVIFSTHRFRAVHYISRVVQRENPFPRA